MRICAVLCLPLLLLWLVTPQPAAYLLWDLANAIGYIVTALVILLFIFRCQPMSSPPFSGRFFVNLHRDLGYGALALTLLHVAILLFHEPLLVEHLKPTAPGYMLAGLGASILLLLLVILSLPTVRRKLWSDYRRYRTLHLWLALGVMLLLYIHLLGSGYYLNSLWKQLLLVAAACLVLAWYGLNRSRPKPNAVNETRRLRGGGIAATLICAAGITLALLLATLLAVWSQTE